ncbi:MAG: ornithine carbamoyltransferase [Roseibium sp.]|uniref:ornithine carbamoyltransferase n=1 Tax=Roseibium sp. TaxID=1936156 RepID=UPI00260AE169|nr:ornithine carbamoyltransferase [Roseibium sp.]MCV0429937.1 ornithine carbamoyltransferase [Roseibium sp.]
MTDFPSSQASTKSCRDLISLDQISASELEEIARRAIVFSGFWQDRKMPKSLTGRRIGLIADLPGWRNPTALMLGAVEMGANCVPVTASLEGKETLEDLAGYLDNWFDCMAIRTPSLARLTQFTDQFSGAVLNLRTNDNHPFETLGDLAFILHLRGSWEDLHVAVVAPSGNILQSWIEATRTLAIKVTQVAPAALFAREDAKTGRFNSTEQLDPLFSADVIVTDCWPQQFGEDTGMLLHQVQITADVLERCRPDVIFIPCPPVTRGHEASTDAMLHPRCLAQPAKAFLLHVQNGAANSSASLWKH